jgi:hypothetical protein
MIKYFKKSCLCELFYAKKQQNEFFQSKCLKDIKMAISQEAIRFSGHQQHVLMIFFIFN